MSDAPGDSAESGKRKPGFQPGHKPIGRPFQKGVSGNPAGRPRTTIDFEREMRSTEGAYAGAIIEMVRKAALGGDIGAAKLWLDRVMGPPSVDTSATEAPAPIRVIVEYGRRKLPTADPTPP